MSTVFTKCSCGCCSECQRRFANRKYYAIRRADRTLETEQWSRIYDLKFKDPTYYEPTLRGPQSSFALVIEALIGRGEARRVERHPGCE
jgi:hypothetical protein